MNHGKKSNLGEFRNLKHYKYISNFIQNLRGGGVTLSIKKKESNMFQNMT